MEGGWRGKAPGSPPLRVHPSAGERGGHTPQSQGPARPPCCCRQQRRLELARGLAWGLRRVSKARASTTDVRRFVTPPSLSPDQQEGLLLELSARRTVWTSGCVRVQAGLCGKAKQVTSFILQLWPPPCPLPAPVPRRLPRPEDQSPIPHWSCRGAGAPERGCSPPPSAQVTSISKESPHAQSRHLKQLPQAITISGKGVETGRKPRCHK